MAASPSGVVAVAAGLRECTVCIFRSLRPGAARLDPGVCHDVRLHPDIGLATVTYLFKGANEHCGSLSIPQRTEPGAINWMTADSGIERSTSTLS